MYHSRAGNIFSISGNLATQFPQAVGWAMAAAIKGEDHLARAGSGRAAAPRLISSRLAICLGVSGAVILNVVTISGRSRRFRLRRRRAALVRGACPGYGIAAFASTQRLSRGYAVTQWAAERARTGAGPTLIELVTYRGPRIPPATIRRVIARRTITNTGPWAIPSSGSNSI